MRALLPNDENNKDRIYFFTKITLLESSIYEHLIYDGDAQG
jgi:hypothetical protein